jgi:hypothetical protein
MKIAGKMALFSGVGKYNFAGEYGGEWLRIMM